MECSLPQESELDLDELQLTRVVAGGRIPGRTKAELPAAVRALPALLVVCHVSLWLSLEAHPFQDLPNHLARASVMLDLLTEAHVGVVGIGWHW